MQRVMEIVHLPKTHLGEGSAVSLVALGSVLLVLSTQAVALRFWARKRTVAQLLLDDWLSLPAWMSFVAATSLVFYCVGFHGLGYPKVVLIPEVPSPLRKAKAIAQSLITINCLCILTFGIAKASALLFYRRLFCVDGKHPTLRKVILVALPVVAVWTLVFELMTIFQCGTHFSAPWDGTKLRYCTWSYPSIEGVAVSNVLLDLFVVALPIYPITKLATTQKSKIAIAGVFLIALVGVAASIARLAIVFHLVKIGRAVVNEDMEYYMSRVTFYFVLETGVTVTVLNLPPIWTALGRDARLFSAFATLDDDESN